jgi:hypothetical protein
MQEPHPSPPDVAVPEGSCTHSGRVSARFGGSALRPVAMSCDQCGGTWRTAEAVPLRVVMGVWVPPQFRPQSIPDREVIRVGGYGQLLRLSLMHTRTMPQLCDMAVVLAAWELACHPTLEAHDAMDLLTSWMDGGPETLYQVAQSVVLAQQAKLVQPYTGLKTREARMGDVHPTLLGWNTVDALTPTQELEPPWVSGSR